MKEGGWVMADDDETVAAVMREIVMLACSFPSNAIRNLPVNLYHQVA